MTVGLVGSGPAAAAVEAALADVDATVSGIEPEATAAQDLSIVVGQVGDAVFERANEHAVGGDARWLAVEVGGVGGYPIVHASVVGFAPDGACYECLARRVAANRDPDAEPTAAQPAHTARFAGAIAGRAAARDLAGEDAAAFGRVTELDGTRRPLLPVPGCGCGSSPDRGLSREGIDRGRDEALARAERGLDERVGIVQQVGEAESFPVPYYLARNCDTGGFSDATAGRDAAGVDAGWDAAFMKALGEGLERYCAGVYRVADLETGTADAVDDAVAPSAFVRPENPPGDGDGTPEGDDGEGDPGGTGGSERPWVAGENLVTGGAVSLPAELVYYPPPEKRIRPAITTGLGLGSGGADALLAGLYEVIERDAAMLAWYSSFDPLAVDVADEDFAQLVGRAGSRDLAVTPLLLTQDVDVPVVATCVHRDEWPRFAVGTSAHLDAARAATDALAEALQNWVELRGMGPDRAATASGRVGHYAEFPEAAASFLDVASSVPAHSLTPDEVPTGPAELSRVIDHVADADMTPYAVRLTTRDVDELGFEAVRVLVRGAQPLFFDEAYFGERAASVPADLGFELRPEYPHHPFP
jgi:ribosomal protein S12 methylthiotransferase accessory factor